MCVCVHYLGTYALSMLDIDPGKGRVVKHYRIQNMDDGGCFITPRKTFTSLDEMVKYYSGTACCLIRVSE